MTEAKAPGQEIANGAAVKPPAHNASDSRQKINSAPTQAKKTVAFKPTTVKKKKTAPNKFGKVNPARDLCLVVGFFGFMLWMTIPAKPGARTATTILVEKLTKATNSVNNVMSGGLDRTRNALETTLTEHLQRKKRIEDCGVFFTVSSVPGAGNGLYAGQDYDTGDSIVLPKGTPLPLVDQGLYVAPHGFLIKHHPKLANVQGKLVTQDKTESLFELKALQPIKPGEELFVTFEEHPHSQLKGGETLESSSMFDHIPTIEAYELADRIRKEADDGAAALQKLNRAPRQLSIKPDPLYETVKKSILHLNPTAGLLLPQDAKQVRAHKKLGSSTYAALKASSLLNIQVFGSCINDLAVNARGASMIARSISSGDVVSRVPLLAISNSMTCGQSDECDHLSVCLGQGFSRLLLCPLFETALLAQQQAEAEGNVVLRWTNETLPKASFDEILGSAAGSLTVEVVSTVAIDAGGELHLAEAAENLIPEHWRLP